MNHVIWFDQEQESSEEGSKNQVNINVKVRTVNGKINKRRNENTKK